MECAACDTIENMGSTAMVGSVFTTDKTSLILQGFSVDYLRNTTQQEKKTANVVEEERERKKETRKY